MNINCSNSECKRFRDNRHWGKNKAIRQGWYFDNSKRAWCPEHNLPEAPPWRERKK